LGAATLASFDYGFDTDGKILSIADAGGTRSFTYDATLQLTGGGYPTATEPRVESYAYDPEGNRTSSHLSTGYAHDQANRLRSDADTCYDYDANGNLVTTPAARRRPPGMGRSQPPHAHRLPRRHLRRLPLRRAGTAHREGRQRRVNQVRLRMRRDFIGI
jgi:hypothetical protein